MGQSFPYAARAYAVEEARRNRWIERFHAALELAYPPGFWDDVARLRRGDAGGLPLAIDFLEADPMFFRSGYVKAELLGLVKRFPLQREQVERLRAFVIRVVHSRDDRDFRRYCSFAQRLDGPGFRSELQDIVETGSSGSRRRARWVLEALAQAERTRAGHRDAALAKSAPG